MGRKPLDERYGDYATIESQVRETTSGRAASRVDSATFPPRLRLRYDNSMSQNGRRIGLSKEYSDTRLFLEQELRGQLQANGPPI